jgi:hypothetical protein
MMRVADFKRKKKKKGIVPSGLEVPQALILEILYL